MHYKAMHNYPTGSKIKNKQGYVFIKMTSGKWKSEHRFNMENSNLHRELREGERVFHMNGDRENNNPKNLVAIQFNTTPFKLLNHREILFIPKIAEYELKKRKINYGTPKESDRSYQKSVA